MRTYFRYAPHAVYKFLRDKGGHLREPALVDDLIQAADIAAWMAEARCNGASAPETFSTIKARYGVVDEYRKQSGKNRNKLQPLFAPLTELDELQPEHGHDDIAADIEREREAERLIIAIGHLDEREQRVIILRYLHDPPLRLNEIGDLIGVSESRVSQIVREVLPKLAEVLGGM